MKMQELYEKSSKKDYIAVANIIKSSANKVDIAHRLANMFANDNPNFNADKFLAACGLTEKE